MGTQVLSWAITRNIHTRATGSAAAWVDWTPTAGDY